MVGGAELQRLLSRKLRELRETNPQFSLRSFAARLKLSPGALSEVLQGKRNLSEKKRKLVLAALNLSPSDWAELRADRAPSATEETSLRLTNDQFRMIADWYHYAILSLVETKHFKSDPEWVSQRLGLRVPIAADALDRLERLGFLRKDEHGQYRREVARLKSSDDVYNASVQISHQETLRLAGQVLSRTKVSERDFTYTTLAVDPAQLPEAKILLREFHEKLAALLAKGDKREVYRIAMQVFPLSRPESL